MNLVGKTLGQFQIVDELGRGGMATVYKAYQPHLQRYVAIKVLSPALAADVDVVKRFLREARAAAALHHVNVISIYDVASEGEMHYIVAEYLEGMTLAQLLEQDGAQSLDRVLHILRQVADALDYAHTQGYIHRDIKPSNIMVDPARNDHVTLMDFGLVQVTGGSRITRTGFIMGTPDYMSPEQARGDAVDHRTDIYSLGVTVYHMLTGKVPFAKSTPHAVLLAHATEEPPAMSLSGHETPPQVEAIVCKSMAKDPNDRYEWAGDMVSDLETAITGPIPLMPLPVGERAGSPPPATRGTPPAGVSRPWPPPSGTPPPPRTPPAGAPERAARPKWVWPVVGVGAAGLLGVLLIACLLIAPSIARLARATQTVTFTPSASPSPTVESTATLTPTPTPSPTAEPTATLTPAPTSSPTAEPTATPTPIPAAGGLLYEEDFTTPDEEWESSESDKVVYRLEGGVYSIEVHEEQWIAWNLFGQEFTDFVLEFETSLVEGDPYNDSGCLFRFQDKENYYEMDINGNGSYAIGKEVEGEWTQIVDWTSDPAIQSFGQVNRVRLIVEGDTFTVYINDQFMTEFSDTAFGGGRIAAAVTAYDEPPARATFDNVRIWEIGSR